MILPTDEQLYHFVDNLEESIRFDFKSLGNVDSILMCGMGGSSISADIVLDLCFDKSRIPIRCMKYSEMPSWAGPSTLVICSSYSGNTQETISAYDQAVACGCKVVVVTAGGKLKDRAVRDSSSLILMPDNMHPRHSIGFMVGYTLAVIKSTGACDITESIASCISSLRDYRDAIMPKGDGKAWSMAEVLQKKVPIMLSDMSLRSVSFRWKTQINENAKYIAFTNQIQEFNRCALEAWNADHGSNGYLLVLSGNSDPRLDNVISKMDEYGCEYHVERFEGETDVENLFRAIILGDYISMYMAEIRGIDAGIVPPIVRLKQLLNERM